MFVVNTHNVTLLLYYYNLLYEQVSAEAANILLRQIAGITAIASTQGLNASKAWQRIKHDAVSHIESLPLTFINDCHCYHFFVYSTS